MSLPEARVLVVEAGLGDQARLAGSLPPAEWLVLRAGNVVDALRLVRDAPVDVVLLDLDLPGADGFESLRQLKELSDFQAIPVIAVTSGNDLREKLRAFDMGVV